MPLRSRSVSKNEKADKEEPAGEEDKAEGEEGLNPPKKKLSPKLMIIIGVAAVLLLGGGGAGLYFSGVLGGSAPKTEEGAAATAEHGAEPPAEGDAHGAAPEAKKGEHGDVASVEQDANAAPTFYSLGDILVNLSGDGKRPNFLKIRASLELASEKDVPAIEALKPRIIDHFQVYLRELRIEDLRGSAGLYRLREELLLRVTEAVQPIRVRDVLFQEMLVQ